MPAVLVAIGALVVVDALLEAAPADRVLRGLLGGGVVLALAEILAVGVPAKLDAYAQHQARLAALAATPRGQVATVRPILPVDGDFWVGGESLERASLREDVARSLFGLDDITFDKPFLDLEPSMGWRFAITPDGGSLVLGHDLALARRQFRQRKLRDADLRVASLDWRERAGRPVVAARCTAGVCSVPRAHRVGVAPDGRQLVRAEDRWLVRGFEHWVIGPDRAVRAGLHGGRLDYTAGAAGWYAVLACDARECWVLDASYVPL
jgi:hypothetical protein